MNTYEWNIYQLDTYPQYEGQSDVVFKAYWTITGLNENGISGFVKGIQDITLNPDDPYIPYNDLTKDQIISWVQTAMGPDQITIHEVNIDTQINEKVNPMVVVLPLPWNN